MQEKHISTVLQVFPNATQLPLVVQTLLEAAQEACDLAYAPYSHFHVGSALLLADGTIIKGANQENASYPLCLCAERTALSVAAANHSDQKILAIAVTAKTAEKELDTPVTPCGACRQVIAEYQQKQKEPIAIWMTGSHAEIWKLDSIEDLLPLAFSGKFLT